MKPLFLDQRTYEAVRNIITSPAPHSEADLLSRPDGRELVETLRLLVENRVLSAEPGRDDAVIEHFRRHLAPPHIRIAYFILAESCNLACSYCFEGTLPTTRASLMTPKVARDSLSFLERMMSLGAPFAPLSDIIFYGGEPLLNFAALSEVLTEVQRRKEASPALWKDVGLSLVTNGTLLTPEIVATLRAAGVSISISLDGPREVTDANRRHRSGAPVFDDVMQGISVCRAAGVPFSLSMTLSREAVAAYDDIMRLVSEVQPSSVGFNLLMSNGACTGDNFDDRAAQFLIDAFATFRSTGLYEDRIMRKVKAFAQSRPHLFDCGAAGGNQVVFTPSGRVGVCHGYVADKRFFPAHIDDSAFDPANDPVFQEWAQRTPLNIDSCQPCEALGICGGGCPMNAERAHGSIWALDERFCAHSKKTLRWLVWDLFDGIGRSGPELA